MRVLLAGNFNITMGTGYAVIIEALALEWAAQGIETYILGSFWTREQHDYPPEVHIIPSDYTWVPGQGARLMDVLDFDHAILAMDVPKIANMLATGRALQDWKCPVSGIFPVESTPILGAWAKQLENLTHCFVISKFGQAALAEVGIDAHYLPMTARIPQTSVRGPTAREALVDALPQGVIGEPSVIHGGDPLLLTVADNQERKALPVIAQTVAHLGQAGVKAGWILVTAPMSQFGWTFPDLLEQVGVADQTILLPWGVSRETLSLAYQAADFFVLASEAEGACLPLYEAMAHGLQPIAPDHTAITEALDGRGVLVRPEWRSVHPFGNVQRWHVEPRDLARQIRTATRGHRPDLVDFIKGRPWEMAANVILEVLSDEKTQADTQGKGVSEKFETRPEIAPAYQLR